MTRPMFYEFRPQSPITSPRGTTLTCKNWDSEAALRMLMNTFATLAKKVFNTDTLKGKFVLTAGMGGMSSAQPLAVTMNEGVVLCVEVRKERIEKKIKEGYCDRMTDNLEEALQWVADAKSRQMPLSVGLVGKAAVIHPELVKRNITPDIVTDQTPAHDLMSYVPVGDVKELDNLREKNKRVYKEKVLDAVVDHVNAILAMQRNGAVCFDYGNNLRSQAETAGVSMRDSDGRYWYPGFVPSFIRPLFCQGKGPFRWAALSCDVADIEKIDEAVLNNFPEDTSLIR